MKAKKLLINCRIKARILMLYKVMAKKDLGIPLVHFMQKYSES
ncbi:MAG: hypothetical protein ABIK27_02010 [Bacteroidota bacterium]